MKSLFLEKLNSTLKYRFIFLIISIFCIQKAAGNNLQLSDAKIIDAAHLQCTISWENSWDLKGIEAPYNHDAIWLFAKYRKDGGDWKHLDLKSGKALSDSLSIEIEASTDKKGLFVKRKNIGSGNIALTEISLELLQNFGSGIYDVQVFGIEMVWVEDGGFYLGDGISYNCFSRGDKKGFLKINSEEEAIKTGKDSFSLADTGQYAPAATIPATYPKGIQGFYCMKYEITQEQYVAFLNSLTFAQQKSRTFTSPDAAPGTLAMTTGGGNRNGIVISEPGVKDRKAAVYACNATRDQIFNNDNDGQNRACNFLNWADIAAYLDWSALRPLTELEFEKTCRGPLLPVQREFAWGTNKVVDANNVIKDGSAEETVKEELTAGHGLASHGYTGLQGPLRAGFGGSDTSNRLSIGAAYFGALEMSGNLVEHFVTVNLRGLQFDGKPGDGELNANGDADVENWPFRDGEGAGYRGGGWLSGVEGEFRDLAISDRFYAGLKPNLRRATSGGRGGRGK